jgi:hypothetical protein
MSLLKAPTPPGGPSITPPSVHGFHADPKMVGLAIGAIIVTIFIVKVWNALPKWLLVFVVVAILVTIGWAGLHIAGTNIDSNGVHH